MYYATMNSISIYVLQYMRLSIFILTTEIVEM